MTARSNALLPSALPACSEVAPRRLPFANDSTRSIDPQKQAANEQAEKSNQAVCMTLASQIEALNRMAC